MATLVLTTLANTLPLTTWGIAARIGAVLLGSAMDRSIFGQSASVVEDVKPTGSSYGTAIPRLYGNTMTPQANVVWGTPEFTRHQGDRGGKGGGGGGGEPDTYSWSFLVLLCEKLTQGEVIRRIWGQDVLLYDADAATPTRDTIRIHYGDADQDPDPFIEAHVAANPDLYEVAATPAYRGVVTVMFENFDLSRWGNYPPQLSFETYKPGGVELRHILTDLASLTAIDPADLEFDAATAVVEGFVAPGREPVRQIMEPLLLVFATDLAAYDGKIWAVPRGSANAIEIDEADLGARVGGNDAESRYTIVREQDLTLPKRLDLTYASSSPVESADGEERPLYETGTQFAVRHSKDMVAEAQTLRTTITMTDDQARKAVERILYDLWLQRTQIQIPLPPKYMNAVPASILEVNLGNRAYRLRATQIDIGLFAELRFAAVPDSASVLTQVAPGAGSTKPTNGEGTGTDPVPGVFRVWSGIDLRDDDTLHPGFYVAATGSGGWGGGTVFWSSDGGTSWTSAGFVSSRSMIGTAVSALANGVAAGAWESGSSVTVDLDDRAAPETATREEVQNGRNLMLLGDEVIGYSTVAAASGNWLLSDILRGLRGTPMTGHAAGERAISLDSRALVRVNVRTDLIGATIQVKVVSPGQALADVTPVSVVVAQNVPVYASPEEVSALDQDWSKFFLLMGV